MVSNTYEQADMAREEVYRMTEGYDLEPSVYCLFEKLFRRYLLVKLKQIISKNCDNELEEDLLQFVQHFEIYGFVSVRLAMKHENEQESLEIPTENQKVSSY